jgi:hypothetical protein
VMNEQLSRLTPFSQQAAPGLSWRTEIRNNIESPKSIMTKTPFISFGVHSLFLSFEYLCFEFVSDFDIRISNFTA